MLCMQSLRGRPRLGVAAAVGRCVQVLFRRCMDSAAVQSRVPRCSALSEGALAAAYVAPDRSATATLLPEIRRSFAHC